MKYLILNAYVLRSYVIDLQRIPPGCDMSHLEAPMEAPMCWSNGKSCPEQPRAPQYRLSTNTSHSSLKNKIWFWNMLIYSRLWLFCGFKSHELNQCFSCLLNPIGRIKKSFTKGTWRSGYPLMAYYWSQKATRSAGKERRGRTTNKNPWSKARIAHGFWVG